MAATTAASAAPAAGAAAGVAVSEWHDPLPSSGAGGRDAAAAAMAAAAAVRGAVTYRQPGVAGSGRGPPSRAAPEFAPYFAPSGAAAGGGGLQITSTSSAMLLRSAAKMRAGAGGAGGGAAVALPATPPPAAAPPSAPRTPAPLKFAAAAPPPPHHFVSTSPPAAKLAQQPPPPPAAAAPAPHLLAFSKSRAAPGGGVYAPSAVNRPAANAAAAGGGGGVGVGGILGSAAGGGVSPIVFHPTHHGSGGIGFVITTTAPQQPRPPGAGGTAGAPRGSATSNAYAAGGERPRTTARVGGAPPSPLPSPTAAASAAGGGGGGGSRPHLVANMWVPRNQQLGCGSFGNVVLVSHVESGVLAALKMEPVTAKHPQIMHEAKVLRIMQGVAGFPKLYYAGVHRNKYNVLIMERLGASLEDLFTERSRRFPHDLIATLGVQMLTRLEMLHRKGIAHRDVKPENFLFGHAAAARSCVYCIDFGLSKNFIDAKTGRHIPFAKGRSLTGTARYASVHAHAGIEPVRRDDVISVGYSLLYFAKQGQLPWQGLQAKTREAKHELIMEKKRAISIAELTRGLPAPYYDFMRHATNISFAASPETAYLKNVLRKLISSFSSNVCHPLTSASAETRATAKATDHEDEFAAAAAAERARLQHYFVQAERGPTANVAAGAGGGVFNFKRRSKEWFTCAGI